MSIKIYDKKFLVKFKHGLDFARKSKDYNPIHIDKKYGYNSMFNKNIVHGIFILILFLKKIKISKKISILRLKVNFDSPIFYDKPIYIKKNILKNYLTFTLFQEKQLKTQIALKILKKNKIKKNLFLTKNLLKILNKISWYVGMKYPGKNSLLKSIDINQNTLSNKKFKIKSKRIDNRMPIINNYLNYRNYEISFVSLIRPIISKKTTKPSSSLLRNVKKIKNNVFIIGASQGIGKDLLKLVTKNKKIKIIATYLKNKIRHSNDRILKIKLDVKKDLSKIDKVIKKFSPLNLYYFATPKIIFSRKITKSDLFEYKKYYLDIPLKILKRHKLSEISFFFPSTEFINFDFKAPYSKIKIKAEKEISKLCKKNNIKYSYHRFPAINSRQSISLANPLNPNLNDYLNSNKNIANKIFF